MSDEIKDGMNNDELKPTEGADELSQLKAQRDEYLQGWQRAKADFINYKKEEMRRMEEVARYGQENLILELITVMDNFDLGLSAMEKNGPVEKGVYMIRSQMEDILKKYGLEKLPVKPGDPYDPSIGEAIAEVEAPPESEAEPGSIADVIEPGYKLYEKLIRPARVRIIKSKN